MKTTKLNFFDKNQGNSTMNLFFKMHQPEVEPTELIKDFLKSKKTVHFQVFNKEH
jgi:hypothetical protein